MFVKYVKTDLNKQKTLTMLSKLKLVLVFTFLSNKYTYNILEKCKKYFLKFYNIDIFLYTQYIFPQMIVGIFSTFYSSPFLKFLFLISNFILVNLQSSLEDRSYKPLLLIHFLRLPRIVSLGKCWVFWSYWKSMPVSLPICRPLLDR